MAASEEKIIEDKVRLSFRNGAFLASVLAQRTASQDALDDDYLKQVARTARFFRDELEKRGLIKKVAYVPSSFWRDAKGMRVSFVDGGVSSASLPNAIPFAVRVGAYCVVCGDSSDDRESFDFPHVLLDEVYSPSGEGFLRYDDPARVCDATRMLLELCTGLHESRKHPRRDLVCVHGPLINPIAPYGLEGFPELSDAMFERLFQRGPQDELERGLVGAYKLAAVECFSEPTPIAGVVERDSGSMQFIETFLFSLCLGDADLKRQRNNLDNYGLSDSRLLSFALRAGEYVGPIEINRQGSEGKWPRDWEYTIRQIPKPNVYFLMPTEDALPLRVELNPAGVRSEGHIMNTLFHTSRLLPNYVFPVGLQIVDQFAKIPRWLQSGVKSQYATQLVLKAISSRDPAALNYVKKVVLGKGRDWFLRPKS